MKVCKTLKLLGVVTVVALSMVSEANAIELNVHNPVRKKCGGLVLHFTQAIPAIYFSITSC
jgi:hypothetical protein